MSQKKSKNTKSGYADRKHRRKQNLWPLVLALGGIALVTLAVFTFQSGKPTPTTTIQIIGSPSLKVDKEKVDLGDVKLGNAAQVSFELTNVGDQTLRFSEAPYIEIKEGC